jgi:hypothetical protein
VRGRPCRFWPNANTLNAARVTVDTPRRRAPARTRYDEVVSALGGHGELVRSPDELSPTEASPGSR